MLFLILFVGRARGVDEQLGLVVSNQIIKLHGGELIIQPKDITQDSFFGFLLPLLTEPSDSLYSSSKSRKVSSRRSPRSSGSVVDMSMVSSFSRAARDPTTLSTSITSIQSTVDALKKGYLTASDGMDYTTSMGLPEEDMVSPSSTSTERMAKSPTSFSPPSSSMITQWSPPLSPTWPPTTMTTDNYLHHHNRNYVLVHGSGEYTYGTIILHTFPSTSHAHFPFGLVLTF